MTHIILGGSCAGKTTFVRRRWLEGHALSERFIEDCPVTEAARAGPARTFVVGFYTRPKRTLGVDQMGRDYRRIHDKLSCLIMAWGVHHDIVMEGNALADKTFLSELRGMAVKLYLIDPPIQVIRERVKAAGVKYGDSIIKMTYRRAIGAFDAFRKDFDHEIIREHSELPAAGGR